MHYIDKLIDYNQEKRIYLKEYLDTNAMVLEMGHINNISAIKDLSHKKRRLITSINVIDDKIIRAIKHLKEEMHIEDLSEIDKEAFPQIRALKIISGDVLKLMVELKDSDDEAKDFIDCLLDEVSKEDSPLEKNKLYYYTNELFKK